MKRKISTTLAVAVITSQIQNVAFAETIANRPDDVNGSISQTVDNSDKDTVFEEIKEDEIQEEGKETKKIEEIDTSKESEVVEEVEANEETEVVGEADINEETESVEEVKEDEKSEKIEEKIEKTYTDIYEAKGKLELDINFSTPIKIVSSDNTNISVTLKQENAIIGTIGLGSDNTEGKIGETSIFYNLETLDSKRSQLKDNAKEVDFYHLTFENLPLGTYSIEIVGAGYETVNTGDIEIQNTSKRVLLGTSEKTIVLDDKGTDDKSDDITEYYPGVLLAGDVNSDSVVDKVDYEALKNEIKNKSYNSKFDLNRDGKVDITDLTYVHQNMGKIKSNVDIVDTDIILNPENIDVKVNENAEVVSGDIKDILKDNGLGVQLSPKGDAEISESNPIEVPINLVGKTRTTTNVEKITIEAPKATAPSKGSIKIPGAGEFKFDESNTRTIETTARNGEAVDVIEIDLGKQVAVSEITIKVTGGRGNKKLAEISKVNFLNNVYKEIPKPKMNIPVINNFTSSTAVGNEAMTLGWNHEVNVTGYEIKVEKLGSNGEVESTSTYKTSENTLKIEKVDGYATYRVSIQSLSGDEWKSGYKDEQDDYDASATGATNLANNSNDKDGIPDNADTNYNPKAWDSISGKLSSNAEGSNGSNFGADSLIELQVIPETAPEGPEGIQIEGAYKSLKVSWKSHKKAKDYDLYYRKIGTAEWKKANDPREPKYVDSDLTNDIPDGVTDLTPDQKTDHDELIRDTKYTITGLEDQATYEIKMTATNHHGTGGLSETYIGSTAKLLAPEMPNYNLINRPGNGDLTDNIISVDISNGQANPEYIVDNDYSTAFVAQDWCGGANYDRVVPIVTFDKEYTIDTIRLSSKIEDPGKYPLPNNARVETYDENGKRIQEVPISDISIQHIKSANGVSYAQLKLKEPIKATRISVKVDAPSWANYVSSISELKFYEYDSLEDDVDALFKDNLMIELNEWVTEDIINNLENRANTKDPIADEYHPNRENILKNIQRAKDLIEDSNIKDKILTLDPMIRNQGNTIGQGNNWQALGVAVKQGDKVNIYIGSDRQDTKFNLAITQHYGESGSYIKTYHEKLKVGKNEITIPESPFNMDYEKGGNLYINFDSNYNEKQNVQVRVSGGTDIPHLNLNNMMDDESKQSEVKDKIRTYINELKTYVSEVESKYPDSVTSEDRANNIYTYDAETSILNSTEIEGDRITLSLAADQVLKGIEDGIKDDENAQVERVYDTLLAWEQLMKVSYAQQGLLEEAIDFNEDGKIDNTPQDELGGKGEQKFFNDNRAPLNRINIKYQRMFTGAFMYASGHHVGIGYGSVPGMMTGVPFKFDENGNLVNGEDGQLFGWGINHEVGHVHDRPGLTYAETTNNILALISQTFNDINKSRIEDSNAYIKVYDKVTSGSEGLASDGLTKLAMFWQLHLAYDDTNTYKMLDVNTDNSLENDTFYAKLYRATRENGIAQKEAGHDQTAQTFIMRSSDAVKKDLREFFEKWGLVASPNTNEYLNSKNYPKEDKAIYYLNDEARRQRLNKVQDMADDTKVIGVFEDSIKDNKYINQKEVPLRLSVDKDDNKILGYEIIRKEATATGFKEVPVGFVERDTTNLVTEYVDVIDTANNRVFEYKVKAYDYNLNVTSETNIGTIKVNHDGSIAKANWTFDTNTRSVDDVVDENTGHGQVANGAINNIKDNNKDTVYKASKATNQNGQVLGGDPYVTVDMGDTKQVVGLKYTPGETTTTKKFSLKNFFKKDTEVKYDPISKYEVLVSEDGVNWIKAHSGTFETNKENTIYFNEAGNSTNTQLWAYNAKYVKLVAKGAQTISIAELDILGPTGDNIEIGVDNNDKIYKNGIGKLKSDYEYTPGKSIPAGSIIVTGEYKGDPAFNVPLVLNEDGENFAIESQAILLAELPEDAELGEVAEGNWVYWITPEQQDKIIDGEENIKGSSIKAELYRYNKLDDNNAPVGERLVSDTFLVTVGDLDKLPEIDLIGGTTKRALKPYNKVVEIDSSTMKKVFENR